MSKNSERFANLMTDRMKQTSNAFAKISVDLGTVNGNLSITPDSLGCPIPKGDYLVNLLLTGETKTSKDTHVHNGGAHGGHESGNGEHIHSDGEHQHNMPDSYRGLQAGDRVLIAWCGNNPVVVAIVVDS